MAIQKWEYKHVPGANINVAVREAAKLGRDGWELVSVDAMGMMWFKRPKQ